MRQQTRSAIANGLDRTRLLVPAELVREGWLALRARDTGAGGSDGQPLPPARLRLLVDGRSGDAHRFLRVGAEMSKSIRAAVAGAGAEIGAMEAILDFGCGCGRVARHWADLEGPEIHGCDYNADLVAWCAANLRHLYADRNELAPTTPYVAGSFDLIYALSVLSHLSEPLQRDWIAEFRRLLRPGGLLIVSLLGESMRGRLAEGELCDFDRGKLVVQRPRMAGRNLCTAYHPRRYVEQSLLADFDEVTPFPLGSDEMALMQTAYIARRPRTR